MKKLQLRIDLHVHTHYSSDSIITPRDLVFYAKKRGLSGVAVTDHDRLDGALKIAKETDFLIIPGTEVTSAKGHIVALNVQEPIPRKLSVSETLDKIHEARGIAVACHPTAFYKGSLGKYATKEFDAIEVINASTFPFNRSVKNARRLATSFQISQVAGTDAHYGPEIGYAYTLIDSEPDVNEVIKAITKGLSQPFGNAIPWKLRLKKELLMLRRRGWSRPD